MGSSPIPATRPVGQAAKTPPFHGGNGSSILPRVTKKRTRHTACSFFAHPTEIEPPPKAEVRGGKATNKRARERHSPTGHQNGDSNTANIVGLSR